MLRISLKFIFSLKISLILIGCKTLPSDSSSISSKSFQECAPFNHASSREYLKTIGQGSSLSEAILHGQNELSSQLSAQITSLIHIDESHSLNQHGQQQTQSTLFESHLISSQFNHAELIKPIKQCNQCIPYPATSPSHSKIACQSYLLLNRNRVAQRLKEEMGNALYRLKQALHDLKPLTPLIRFTQAWQEAKRAYHTLLPHFRQLKVLNRFNSEFKSLESELNQIRILKNKRYASLSLWIHPLQLSSKENSATHQKTPISRSKRKQKRRDTQRWESQTNELQHALQFQLMKTVKHYSLKPWSQSKCPESSSQNEVIQVLPQGTFECKLGLIGPQCKLTLSGSIRLCPKGEINTFTWHTLKLIGVHTQDASLAFTNLVKKIESTSFDSLFSETLSSLLILDE